MRSVMPGMLRLSSAVRIGPSHSRQRMVPFQRPSITDSAASIGQSLTSFFETAIAARVIAMNEITDAVAVVITGPMVGVELAVAVFFNPVFDRLPDDAFRAIRGRASRVLGAVMPFWYAATLMLLAVAAVRAGGGSRTWLCGIAAGLMAAVVLLTVTTLVPINNRIAKWPATGELSRELAARWDRLHRLRVAVLVLLFAVLAVAVT